jgi:hypothetical protein
MTALSGLLPGNRVVHIILFIRYINKNLMYLSIVYDEVVKI